VTIGMARGLLALAFLAYLAVFAAFPPLQLQDFPNHLARAQVMADLLFNDGAEFGRNFQFHFQFVPYLLGDLLLTVLVQLTGLTAAGVIWAAVTFLSLPCALAAYLRVKQTAPDVTLLMLFTSLYLSTDTFFVLGFLEFKLSIALVLVALTVVELLRKRWSRGRFAIYAVVVVIAYFTHLAAVVFIGVAVGAAAVCRLVLQMRQEPANRAAVIRVTLNREMILLAPVLCMLVWHFLAAVAYRQPQDIVAEAYNWGTFASKVSRLSWGFIRYNRSQDAYVVATFAAFLMYCVSEKRFRFRIDFVGPQVLEALTLGLVFLGLYFILPFEQAEASYIDVRALAVAPLFVVFGLLSLPPRQPSAGSRLTLPAIALASAVACVNLGYLAVHFAKENEWLAQYRAVVANIPEQGAVLPVYTGRRTANIYDHLHTASFAVIDRHALTPYLFTGDRGNPMKYFRYTNRPYTPDEFWYQSSLDRDVDWKEVARSYRFLLILKPFMPDRIPVKTRTVAENSTAVLLAIE